MARTPKQDADSKPKENPAKENKEASESDGKRILPTRKQEICLASYLCGLFLVLVVVAFVLWSLLLPRLQADSPQTATREGTSDTPASMPVEEVKPDGKTQSPKQPDKPERCILDQKQLTIMGLVLVLGAMGGALYGMIVFCLHFASDDFDMRWRWWYWFRPPVGAGIALALFLAVRGGLVSLESIAANSGLYGIGALAVLSGMFSEQVSKKLSEIFKTIFRTESDTRRRIEEEPNDKGDDVKPKEGKS